MAVAGLFTGAVLVWPLGGPAPTGTGTGGAATPADRTPTRAPRVPGWAVAWLRWRGRWGWWGGRRPKGGRGRGASSPGWVAEFAELAAVGLEAGLAPSEAARLALHPGSGSALDDPAFDALDRTLRDSAQRGTGLGAAVAEAARHSHDAGTPLRFLAQAWSLTDDLGAPAGSATRTAARVLRGRDAAEARRRVVLAGPRASMWLLSLLPATGPVMGAILGIPVARLYGSSAALASTGAGVVLTAAGWAWARAILARARRPRGLRP
jgi:tight adherence protein B